MKHYEEIIVNINISVQHDINTPIIEPLNYSPEENYKRNNKCEAKTPFHCPISKNNNNKHLWETVSVDMNPETIPSSRKNTITKI